MPSRRSCNEFPWFEREGGMVGAAADRNLLFGILALQLDFITRDALIAAMNTWVLEKSADLGSILLRQKALTAEHHALLARLVEEHLKQHDNDPAKSLASVSTLDTALREQLRHLPDAE